MGGWSCSWRERCTAARDPLSRAAWRARCGVGWLLVAVLVPVACLLAGLLACLICWVPRATRAAASMARAAGGNPGDAFVCKGALPTMIPTATYGAGRIRRRCKCPGQKSHTCLQRARSDAASSNANGVWQHSSASLPARHWAHVAVALGSVEVGVDPPRQKQRPPGYPSTPVTASSLKRGGTYRTSPPRKTSRRLYCCSSCSVSYLFISISTPYHSAPVLYYTFAATLASTCTSCIHCSLHPPRHLFSSHYQPPRSWIPTGHHPPLSHSPRESTAASTPISTPIEQPGSPQFARFKKDSGATVFSSWNRKPHELVARRRPEADILFDNVGDSNFSLFPDSSMLDMAETAMSIDIQTPPRYGSNSPQNKESNLTSAIREAKANNDLNSPPNVPNPNGTDFSIGRPAITERHASNGLLGSSIYSNSGPRPIQMKDRPRRESNNMGSFAGGMSWGGVSVGSWIRDE